MRHALYSPLSSAEPIRTEQAWAAPLGTLSGKRGLTRCELKRPSFGCLIYSNGYYFIVKTMLLTCVLFTGLVSSSSSICKCIHVCITSVMYHK